MSDRLPLGILAEELPVQNARNDHQDDVRRPPPEVDVPVERPEGHGHESRAEGEGQPDYQDLPSERPPPADEVHSPATERRGQGVQGEEGPVPGLDSGVLVVLEGPVGRNEMHRGRRPVGHQADVHDHEHDLGVAHHPSRFAAMILTQGPAPGTPGGPPPGATTEAAGDLRGAFDDDCTGCPVYL